MGIKITTDDYGIKVWRSDKHGFPQYAVITGKTESGKNEYQEVRFRRGVEIANGDEIYIDDAFPTVRSWKDRQTGEERYKSVWQIMEFSYRSRHEDESKTPKKTISEADLPDSFAAAQDDIPF